MKYLLFALFFVTIALQSCHNDESVDLPIPENQFVNLYADMLIIREEAHFSLSDSLTTKLRIDSLYASYHVTDKQAEIAIQYYKKDLHRWKQFYENVIRRLDSLQQMETQRIGK